MKAEALEKRLRLGEDSVTELKSVVQSDYKPDSNDLAKEICAFANTKGGLLVLGVEDDGTVTGIGSPKQADALMLKVGQLCQDAIQPSIWCTTEKVEIQGVMVLAVEVPAFSPNRPYQARGRYYVRDINRAREAKREELIRLLQSADSHYDEQSVSGATLEDLDQGAIRAFVEAVYETPDEVSWERYLQKLNCLGLDGTPTVAGILLFGREPQRWLMDGYISAIVFRGKEISEELADRKEIGGRLQDQIEAAVDFLRLWARTPSHVEGTERVEEGIPERVLREAVVNAVVHRDYRAASQTRIFVFDDRVEIVNPGELLNRLTLEGIQVGVSQRRNPVLAGLQGKIRRRENVGAGVPLMIRLMRERKLPEPEFVVGSGHFRVVLRWGEAGNG